MTKFVLQALAMIFMVCDHLSASLLPGPLWLGWVGRLAFPIFAFLLTEGYFHTTNFKGYAKRMFLFALLSEIPMNLLYGGTVIYPFHQNVLWLFLVGLFYMKGLDRILSMKGKEDTSRTLCVLGTIGKLMLAAGLTIFLFLFCSLTMMDYYGFGILMILVFYAGTRLRETKIRGRKIPAVLVMAGQLAAMYYINVEMIMGEIRVIQCFGRSFDIPVQGLALLSLPLIWTYHGTLGYHSRWWKWFCYAFYPVHMLVLAVLWLAW